MNFGESKNKGFDDIGTDDIRSVEKRVRELLKYGDADEKLLWICAKFYIQGAKDFSSDRI